jgi:hypothetical protein
MAVYWSTLEFLALKELTLHRVGVGCVSFSCRLPGCMLSS